MIRYTLTVILALVGHVISIASTLYIYDVAVKVYPLSERDLEYRRQIHEQTLKRGGFAKPQDIEALRKAAIPMERREKNGFEQKGIESFALSNNSTFVTLMIPSANSGAKAFTVREAYEDEITLKKGLNLSGATDQARIIIGDERMRFKFAAERILFANVDYKSYEIIEKKNLPDGTYFVRVRDNYDPKNKPTHHLVDLWYKNSTAKELLRAKHYQSPMNGPPYLMKEYAILEQNKVGDFFINKKIAVRRFSGGKAINEWMYTLKETRDNFDCADPNNVFSKSDSVVDSRLGNDKQVKYDWTGTLPTMDELSSMRNQIEKPIFGVAKPMTAIWAGVGLLLGAIGFAVIRHKSSETKKKI